MEGFEKVGESYIQVTAMLNHECVFAGNYLFKNEESFHSKQSNRFMERILLQKLFA